MAGSEWEQHCITLNGLFSQLEQLKQQASCILELRKRKFAELEVQRAEIERTTGEELERLNIATAEASDAISRTARGFHQTSETKDEPHADVEISSRGTDQVAITEVQKVSYDRMHEEQTSSDDVPAAQERFSSTVSPVEDLFESTFGGQLRSESEEPTGLHTPKSFTPAIKENTKPKLGRKLPAVGSSQAYSIIHNDYPTIVRSAANEWIELRCLICGINATTSGVYLRGVNGFRVHLRSVHGGTEAKNEDLPAETIVKQCTFKPLTSEEAGKILDCRPNAYTMEMVKSSTARNRYWKQRSQLSSANSDHTSQDVELNQASLGIRAYLKPDDLSDSSIQNDSTSAISASKRARKSAPTGGVPHSRSTCDFDVEKNPEA